MTDEQKASRHERLAELLADERIGSIDADERAELEALLEQPVGEPGLAPDHEQIAREIDNAIGRLIVALDRIDPDDRADTMPDALKQRLASRGAAVVAAGDNANDTNGADSPTPIATAARSVRKPSSHAGWYAAAACLVLGITVSFMMLKELDDSRLQVTALRLAANQQAALNESLLADARGEAAELGERLTALQSRNLDLATRLADATGRADEAEQRVALLEGPQDPAELERARRQLLDVNGTIRVAWQPFDVPGMPDTEQPGVQGDVVWNDSLQEGYLRFVGLGVNDPTEEQYQVWVIDERGMEQKVSGGVFNSTETGELIVPIEPGIDVGNVQVFAITVEEPGGIWVPDLRRRVVVAPRPEDG